MLCQASAIKGLKEIERIKKIDHIKDMDKKQQNYFQDYLSCPSDTLVPGVGYHKLKNYVLPIM